MKVKIVALALTLAILSGGGYAFWSWTRTPAYSLRQIQTALEAHDVAKFEKHIDVQSVSSRLIDDLTGKALEESKPQSGAESLGTAFAVGLIQLVKPRLVEAIQEQAARLVEEGNFETSPFAESKTKKGEDVSLRNLSKQIGADEDSFTGITYTNQRGKIALVGLGFRNQQLRSDLVLELKMRDMGGYWQLVEFSNLVELLDEIEQLQAARLAEINHPIQQEISSILRVERTHKSSRTDRWGISKNVDLELDVRNISARKVAGFAANLRLFDPAGELVKELKIQDGDPIAPSKTGKGTWSIDVNMFDSSDNRLYELPGDQVRFEIAFSRISFSDGTEIELVESLKEATSLK